MEELLELIKDYGQAKYTEGVVYGGGHPMSMRPGVTKKAASALDLIESKIRDRIVLHNVAMDMYECLAQALDKIVAIEDNPEHEERSLFFLNSAISIAGNARTEVAYMAADHIKGKDNEKD